MEKEILKEEIINQENLSEENINQALEEQKEDYFGLVIDCGLIKVKFNDIKTIIEEIRDEFKKYQIAEGYISGDLFSKYYKEEYELTPSIEKQRNNLYYGLGIAIDKISKLISNVESIDVMSINPKLHAEIRGYFANFICIDTILAYYFNGILKDIDIFIEETEKYPKKIMEDK